MKNHERYYCRASSEAIEAFRDVGIKFRESRVSGEFYVKEAYCDYYNEATEDGVSSGQIELSVIDGKFYEAKY